LNIDANKKEILEISAKLLAARKLLSESEEYMEITQKPRINKIEALAKKREALDNEIAQLRMEMSEASPEVVEDIEKTESLIAKLMKQVKAKCHAIPVEAIAKRGIKILDDEKNPNITITVSKAQTASSYDVNAMLEEMPDLVEAELDGDFVVVRSVDAAVLERLVEEDQVSKDVFKFRTIVKTKNPSVRVNFGE
jgi:hypothetical protein